MKKTSNKGFSMVELIIVIAIMAILAAALAPALIKYINKSRLSTDIQTGSTIASAINSALAVEKAYDDAATNYDKQYTDVDTLLGTADGSGTNPFADEVASVVGATTVSGKSKKDLDGAPMSQKFTVYIDVSNNKVTVWYGGFTDDDHQVSPNPGASMAE